jgi:hypothetical protein|nr:MAG TPA: hypothetical protein [Caudoviricetes sp.]
MNFIQYIKQAWKAGTSGGTPLSPDRLNHMEDGIKNNNNMISELNNNNITNNICTNLLKPTLQTTTKNGVTCTNNNDGTYTFIGTATAETEFTFSTIKLKYGKYKLLDALGYQRTSNNAWVKTLHDGDIFEVDADKPILQIHMHFAQGTTANNLNKKPMITTNLNATHDDFVSYTGDTGRLNADVALLNNNIGQVELNSLYGATTAKTLNIDTINNDKGYILRCQTNTLQGTLPTSASLIGGNSFLLIGFSNIVNQKPRYGIQIAFGFGSNKIAIRNAPYVEGGGNWTNWRAI